MRELINPDQMYAERIRALASGCERVLDFGAGRGVNGIDLRALCNEVHGCDADLAVRDNPFLHHAVVIAPGAALPYPDDHFDLIVSRYVLEHLTDPSAVAAELIRVLRPGGRFCALTPNKYGYVALAASVVPNSLHVAVLKLVQPEKAEEDTFPTAYRVNSERDIKSCFGEDVHIHYASGESAYNFGMDWVAKCFNLAHQVLPDRLQTAMIIDYQKS